MAWDKLDIQQIIKEQVVGKQAVQEELPLKTAENLAFKDEPKEPVKKKTRRRPRHKKRKPSEAKADEPLPVISIPETAEKNFPVVQPMPLDAVPLVIIQTEAKETAVTVESKEPAIPLSEKEKSDESIG
jgi:hypothetical protein